MSIQWPTISYHPVIKKSNRKFPIHRHLQIIFPLRPFFGGDFQVFHVWWLSGSFSGNLIYTWGMFHQPQPLPTSYRWAPWLRFRCCFSAIGKAILSGPRAAARRISETKMGIQDAFHEDIMGFHLVYTIWLFNIWKIPLINMEVLINSTTMILRNSTTYPLVTVYKKRWKDPAFCSWENSLFRLGHFQ